MKRIAMVCFVMVMLASALLVTSCGKSAEGRWYYIHNPQFEYSVSLESDGSYMIGDDVMEGGWSQDGDTITVGGYTFTLGDYQGYQVLYNGNEPEYCREGEANTIHELIRASE